MYRTYYFSDCYGGSHDPFSAPDADALISTDFRSPLHPTHREFDICGQEHVTDHILRLLEELHDQLETRTDLPRGVIDPEALGKTGVFVNAAPRTSNENGKPFYVAETDHLRIVTTPLEVLSCIRDKVKNLHALPNDGEHLYGPGEQFRSGYAPLLLQRGHGQTLEACDPGIIPPYDQPWHIAYVDRFGNIVTHAPDTEKVWHDVLQNAEEPERAIVIAIANMRVNAVIADTLGSAQPSSLSIYRNGNIDIARKWAPGETRIEREEKSAYRQLGSPSIGTPIISEPFKHDKEFEEPVNPHIGITTQLNTKEGPLNVERLAELIRRRLKPSAGLRPGRPTNEAWVHRPKIPMSKDTTDKLTVLADEISTAERKVTPMQVAAQLIEEELAHYFEARDSNAREIDK